MAKSKKRKKKKFFKVVFAVIAIILLAIVISVKLFLGHAAKFAVSNTIPQITGTSASLGDASFKFLICELEINDLIIGNPDGYNTDSAFKIGKLQVGISPFSLFSDTIKIKKILIEGVQVTYEAGMPSNLGQIKANINAASKKKEPEEKAKSEKEKGKSFYIEEIVVSKAEIRVSAKALGGKAVTIPLSDIHMTKIGKKDDGVSFAEAFDDIFTGIYSSVSDTVKKSGSFLKEGASGIIESIGGLFE